MRIYFLSFLISVCFGINQANGSCLGIVVTQAANKGILVENVARGSFADRSGLRPGDIITKINGHKTCCAKHFVREINHICLYEKRMRLQVYRPLQDYSPREYYSLMKRHSDQQNKNNQSGSNNRNEQINQQGIGNQNVKNSMTGGMLINPIIINN